MDQPHRHGAPQTFEFVFAARVTDARGSRIIVFPSLWIRAELDDEARDYFLLWIDCRRLFWEDISPAEDAESFSNQPMIRWTYAWIDKTSKQIFYRPSEGGKRDRWARISITLRRLSIKSFRIRRRDLNKQTQIRRKTFMRYFWRGQTWKMSTLEARRSGTNLIFIRRHKKIVNFSRLWKFFFSWTARAPQFFQSSSDAENSTSFMLDDETINYPPTERTLNAAVLVSA